MGILDSFLKLTISVQIRVGIIIVVLFAILISLALLTVSTLIQYNTMTNYYENIIEDEDNKMLLNFEQYIHTIEKLFVRKSKLDLEFYSLLENITNESLEGLELNSLLNIDIELDKTHDVREESDINSTCYYNSELNCIVYKMFPDNSYKATKEFNNTLKYYNLIFPLLNLTLQNSCAGTYLLKHYNNLQFYKNFVNQNTYETIKVIFYAGTNITPFNNGYNETQYNAIIRSNILDHLIDLFILIPTFNKKATIKYMFQNLNNFSSYPLITTKYLFEGETNNPYIRNNFLRSYIYENNLLFESKILEFSNIDISEYLDILIDDNLNIIDEAIIAEYIEFIISFLWTKLNSLKVFNWSDNVFENLISFIFEKYKNNLNLLSVLHSLFSILKNQIFKENPYYTEIKKQNFITRLILSQFSCIYIVKQELLKIEITYDRLKPFNITKCDIYFNKDLDEYLKNSPEEINVYERRKIKMEIIKYDINYIYYNNTNNEEINKEYSLHYNEEEEKDKKSSKYLRSFKIYQGMYPRDTLNAFSSAFYNNFVSVNFYFSNLSSNYEYIDTIHDMCLVFFRQVLYPSLILWGVVLLIIIIIVFRISHSISDPIDKLIQSISMNNKSSKELNKYLKNISYKDDSTINDLFILCKKLIIGGFKKEVDEEFQQKKKVKTINAYNNISLVKTNNMIINESEIMKGEKKQEINYFEISSIYKDKQFSHLNSQTSSNFEKKFNYNVLSGQLFGGKFYQYNKGYLIKDKDYYEILTNEIMIRKKKFNDENKSKNNKIKNNHNK